jgi:hypothetical protein
MESRSPPSNPPSAGDAQIKEWVDRAAKRGDEWGKQPDVAKLPTVRRALPVEPVEPPIPSTTAPEVTYRVVNNVPGGVLNLREGPGSLSRLLVRIKAGTGGIRIGESRNNGPTLWRKIWVGPYTGWVNQEYLDAETTH